MIREPICWLKIWAMKTTGQLGIMALLGDLTLMRCSMQYVSVRRPVVLVLQSRVQIIGERGEIRGRGGIIGHRFFLDFIKSGQSQLACKGLGV